MLTYLIFRRNFHTWRMGDFGVLQDESAIKILPRGALMHILSNMGTTEQIDTFDFETLPFFNDKGQLPNFKKSYLFPDLRIHNESDPYHTDAKYRYLFAKARREIQKFKTDAPKYRLYPVASPEQILIKDSTLTFLSYNHLFNIMPRAGELLLYRKFMMILGSIINTISAIPNDMGVGNHYIHIPLMDRAYSLAEFVPSTKRVTNGTVKHHTLHYYFMMQYLHFLNPNSKVSIFELIPEHVRPRITFAFTRGKHCVFHNLEDIMTMYSPSIERKIIEQLNMLSQVSVDTDVKVEPDKPIDKDQAKKQQEEIATKREEPKHDPSEIEKVDSSLLEIPDDFEDEPIEEEVVKPTPSKAKKKDPKPEKTKPNTFDKDESTKKKPLNETRVSPITDAKTAKAITVKTVNESVSQGKKLIEKSEDITPKQKSRMTMISEKYKELKFGDQTFEEILTADTDVAIDNEGIPAIENDVPSKSMTKSTAVNFDRAYMEKQFKKDLVTSLTSFSSVGMFVTGFEEKIKSDEINRTVVYKVTFTDMAGAKHTSTFELPHVEPDGTYLTNGCVKYFKKQPVNIPICKVSPTRVSLVSNYNKTLIERVTTVAHSFPFYIERVIEKLNASKQAIKLKHDNNHWKTETLPYEFTVIAKKYSAINFQVKRFRCNLSFNRSYQGVDGTARPIIELPMKARTAVSNSIAQGTTASGTISAKNVAHVKKGDVVWLNHGYVCRIKELGLVNKSSKTRSEDVPEDAVYNMVIEALPDEQLTTMDKIYYTEKMNGYTYIGVVNDIPLFMDLTCRIYAYYDGRPHVLECSLVGLLSSVLYENQIETFTDLTKDWIPPVTTLTEWCNIKILDKNFPLILLLAYKYGLLKMLDYLDVPYTVYDKVVPRNSKKASDIVIRFADKTLVFNRYPLVQSLIFAGLSEYDTKDHSLEDFDSPEVYYELLEKKGVSINYLEGIDAFFELFLDAMTKDALAHMKEPTNIRDLFIRAVVMLSTEDHSPAESMKNFRIRSYERMAACVYYEFAKQYAKHRASKSPHKKFTINPNAVYQKIIQDAASDAIMDVCNPVHQIKEKTVVTYAGMGGRSSDAFTIQDRMFPHDGVGKMSDATVDSGKVGQIAYLSMDPTIVNTRGFMVDVDSKDLEPTQILSCASNLMPGATHDD